MISTVLSTVIKILNTVHCVRVLGADRERGGGDAGAPGAAAPRRSQRG